MYADANGGVLLLTRKGACHDGPLCGGSSSPGNTRVMVRFDNAGRMQVVNASGGLVAGHRDAFEVGCGHSWGTRIVWDPRVSRYAMVCATDNDCGIAQPHPNRTVAGGTCDGTLFGGDLVLAEGAGYWTAWSQGGTARLSHFGTGAADKSVTTGARTQHPHLVPYGGARMLLAWESVSLWRPRSTTSPPAVPSAAGSRSASRTTVFQACKAYPDGSAAYPAAGAGPTSVRIARVMPMA